MVTSPAPDATRITRALPRSQPGSRHGNHAGQRIATPERAGILVRLELPDIDSDDQQPDTDHARPGDGNSSKAPDYPVTIVDPEQIARAVEQLLRALAPALTLRVHVELTGATGFTAAAFAAAAFIVAPGTDQAGRTPAEGRTDVDPTRSDSGPELPDGTTAPADGEPAGTAPAGLSHFALTSVGPGDPSFDSVGSIGAAGSGGPAGPVALGLDLAGRTLTVDGEQIALTRREFDLLAYLHRRRGIAFSRRELMSTVWQTGYLEGDRTIDVHVRRLRIKLGRHAHRLGTLRGFGYRFD